MALHRDLALVPLLRQPRQRPTFRTVIIPNTRPVAKLQSPYTTTTTDIDGLGVPLPWAAVALQLHLFVLEMFLLPFFISFKARHYE